MRKFDKTSRYYISTPGIILNSVLIVLFFAMAICLYIFPSKILSQEVINYYSETIFPIIALPFNSFSGFFMQSITELFAVVGSGALLIYVIYFVIKSIVVAVRRGGRSFCKYFLTRIRILASLTLIGVILFQLMIGLNYSRTPMSVRLKLDGVSFNGEGYSCEQYMEALDWAYFEMLSARSELGEDYNGVAHMCTSFDMAVYDANSIILGMDDYFYLGLSPTYVRVKPVMLSYLWSYTGITGFYCAFLGESNINVDYMDILHFPVTLCHEIIHAKGYSREYDANTAAVIACIESSRPDFRYAGYYYIFMNLYGITKEYAEHEGVSIPDYFSYPDFDMVRADIRASAKYDETLDWNELTNFINSFSEDVNDAYLKSNKQDGGTETYQVPPNLYVDFYYTYVPGAGNVSN